MTAREFDLGDILSITTGMLVSPRGMVGLCDAIEFVAGEPVWTHQIPRVSREAAPAILRQHPQLAEVDASSVTSENWETWLADQMTKFGARLSIRPMNEDEHERVDPLSELAEMVHPDKIVVVKT